MAKTITVSELLPPTNLTATAVSGGSLVAGTTYYYKMIAVEMSGSNGRVDSTYASSAPSAEVSVTCDATNKSVQLNWTATTKIKTAGYLGYLIYRTTISGDYAYTTAHLITPASGNGYPTLAATTATTYTDNGSLALYTSLMPALGCPLVVIDGGTSGDPITEEDIYQGYVTAGKTTFAQKTSFQDAAKYGNYFFNGFVLVGLNTTTYLKIQDGRTVYIQGRLVFQTTNIIYFYMGTSTGRGATIGVAGVCGDCQSAIRGYLYIYNSKIIDLNNMLAIYNMGSSYFAPAASLGGLASYDNTSVVKNTSIYMYGSNNNFSGGIVFNNCLVETYPRIESFNGYVPELNGISFIGLSNTLYAYGAYYVRTIDCSMLENTGAIDIQFHGGTTYRMIDLINFTAYHNPLWARSVSNPTYGFYFRKWSVDLTIKDKEDNYIENAIITLKDSSGTSQLYINSTATYSNITSRTTTSITVSNGALFTIGDVIKICTEKMLITNIVGNVLTVTRGYDGTIAESWLYVDKRVWLLKDSILTNSSGTIEQQYLLQETYQGKTASGNYPYDTVSYGPYTLTVSKTGYETYTSTFDVTEKMDLIISLKPIVPIRQTLDGELLLANQPETGSSAKLLKI